MHEEERVITRGAILCAKNPAWPADGLRAERNSSRCPKSEGMRDPVKCALKGFTVDSVTFHQEAYDGIVE